MQAKNYPFYTSQFHPEKNPFEWRVDANRSLTSIEVVQLLSNNFVAKARLSPNRYSNPSNLYRELIYNYRSRIAPDTSTFQEIYEFMESGN